MCYLIKVGRCRLTVSKPMLKAPGLQRLNLKCDELPSNLAFNFNLRRYSKGWENQPTRCTECKNAKKARFGEEQGGRDRWIVLATS